MEERVSIYRLGERSDDQVIKFSYLRLIQSTSQIFNQDFDDDVNIRPGFYALRYPDGKILILPKVFFLSGGIFYTVQRKTTSGFIPGPNFVKHSQFMAYVSQLKREVGNEETFKNLYVSNIMWYGLILIVNENSINLEPTIFPIKGKNYAVFTNLRDNILPQLEQDKKEPLYVVASKKVIDEVINKGTNEKLKVSYYVLDIPEVLELTDFLKQNKHLIPNNDIKSFKKYIGNQLEFFRNQVVNYFNLAPKKENTKTEEFEEKIEQTIEIQEVEPDFDENLFIKI